MLTVILAGPGGNWLPMLGIIVACGLLVIGANALYLKIRNRKRVS